MMSIIQFMNLISVHSGHIFSFVDKMEKFRPLLEPIKFMPQHDNLQNPTNLLVCDKCRLQTCRPADLQTCRLNILALPNSF